MSNINLKETLRIEFKSDLKRLPDGDIIDVVVAFANTDGGDLYLGVEDDGEITGIHKAHSEYSTLPAFIANKTVPPVAVRVELINPQCPILKISVPKNNSIVASTSGKLLRRRLKTDGFPENVPLYPYEIVHRLSSLSLLDYSAQAVVDATVADLDPLERQRLRKSLNLYDGDQSLVSLEDDELDKALNLVTTVDGKLYPTYTGLLLIGKELSLQRLMPTAETTIQVMSGTDLKVNENFRLPLLAAFDKLKEYFDVWNVNEEVEVGLFRMSIPHYGSRAFREALVNAFAHRDYTMLGRVRLVFDDTGMTISNPGGFIEGISYKNLIEAEPRGRNPLLADCLKRIGLAERSGRGIDRIYEGSLRYGKDLPDYSGSTSTTVTLFIPNSVPDKEFIQLLNDEQKKANVLFSLYHLLILGYLQRYHRASFNVLKNNLNINEGRLRSALETLVELGIIEAKGNTTAREYILSAKVYKKQQNISGYIRQSGIDSIRYSELILKFVQTQGRITRSEVVALLNVTESQAYRILKKLTADNILKLVGSGKNAHYVLNKI